MANPNCDCCNPLAVWEDFIAFLLAAFATTPPPPRNEVPISVRPPFLSEPNFDIRERSGRFQVGKPLYDIFDAAVLPSAPFTVIRDFATHAEADNFSHGLPKVRLPTTLNREALPDGSVVTLPEARHFDWSSDPDAKKTLERLTEFLDRIALGATLPRVPNVVTNLVVLPGGIHAETRDDPADPTRGIVLIDPFKISPGTLHLCASYVHELTHVQRLLGRGFNPTELVAVLPREDYVLLSLDEELACFKNAVTAVQQFLALVPADRRPAFTEWVATALPPPAKLYFAEGLAAMSPATVEKLTHKLIGDFYVLFYQDQYARIKSRSLTSSEAARTWISSSEWTDIKAKRSTWEESGVAGVSPP